MLQKERSYYFKVKESGKTSLMSREELLQRDPVALVEFYEKNMNVVPARN